MRTALLLFALIAIDSHGLTGGSNLIPTELYLVLEIDEKDGTGAGAVLEAALGAAPFASVLISPPAGRPLAIPLANSIVDLLQSRSIAALIADDASLARQLRADGVHLTWSKVQAERFAEAREILGARFIIGVDAGRSRDDAMSLGEAGADYIAFGIPPHVEDRATAAQRQADLVTWWNELFEIPCVAFDATDATAASRLAGAGADFVAVKITSADTPGGARDKVAAFASAIAAAKENV